MASISMSRNETCIAPFSYKNIQFSTLLPPKKYVISICNRMRPSRIRDKFSRVFSKFSFFDTKTLSSFEKDTKIA